MSTRMGSFCVRLMARRAAIELMQTELPGGQAGASLGAAACVRGGAQVGEGPVRAGRGLLIKGHEPSAGIALSSWSDCLMVCLCHA